MLYNYFTGFIVHKNTNKFTKREAHLIRDHPYFTSAYFWTLSDPTINYISINTAKNGHFLNSPMINQVSRNRLHNTARSGQHLNFGLSWSGQGQSVKAKHCYSLKFSLLCTDTALSQSSIGAQYSKQHMIKFSQCLAELAQKFKFL